MFSNMIIKIHNICWNAETTLKMAKKALDEKTWQQQFRSNLSKIKPYYIDQFMKKKNKMISKYF